MEEIVWKLQILISVSALWNCLQQFSEKNNNYSNDNKNPPHQNKKMML